MSPINSLLLTLAAGLLTLALLSQAAITEDCSKYECDTDPWTYPADCYYCVDKQNVTHSINVAKYKQCDKRAECLCDGIQFKYCKPGRCSTLPDKCVDQ